MDIDKLASQIIKAETREGVSALLFGLKKETLVNLARKLDIYPTNKSKEILIDAIIEGTIGARLRSIAIRNIKLNGR